MGNKRKREEEEAKIAKKIKKLERKLQRKRNRNFSTDDEDSETEIQVLPSLTPSPVMSPRASFIQHEIPSLDMPNLNPPSPREIMPSELTQNVDPVPGSSNTDIGGAHIACPEGDKELELEDDILSILGEAPQPDLVLGKNIHRDIASRWQDILLKGLSKEVKEPIMKKYLIPANCSLLVAPILNPEAKAAVPEVLSKRDTTLLQKQNQIGVTLAALSQVFEMIIRNETSKQALLQPLSDACRILCDSHHTESKTRRSILMSSINTSLRETLAQTERDNYLFGTDLAEKLKVAKNVQKTGESLVKTTPAASTSKNINNYKNTTTVRKSLNFRGPVQRKPPIRANESTRGRPLGRFPRSSGFPRHPPPQPKASSPPPKRNYRR